MCSPSQGYYQSQIESDPNKLSEKEKEHINGMIEVQLYHAQRCDNIQNRTMADKQKALDMERVDLLRKVLRVMG